MPTVLAEAAGPGVRLLRINRPDARNALDMATRRLLLDELQRCTADGGVRAIVIAGSEKSFAAGADIRELAGAGSTDMLLRGSHELWRGIAACPKPMVAAVRGFALGGGCELAMSCDLIVAGDSARFGQPEIRLGIMPGGGGTQRLTRAVGKYRAMRYLLTGDPIAAADAFAMGLISELVPDAEVEARAIDIAARIALLAPIAVQQIKEVVSRGLDAPLETALALESKALYLLYSTDDQKEGMAAFLEKRAPVFTGR